MLTYSVLLNPFNHTDKGPSKNPLINVLSKIELLNQSQTPTVPFIGFSICETTVFRKSACAVEVIKHV